MAAIFCPRCGRQAGGGKGFWDWSKPCGWNVAAVNEIERAHLRQLPKTFLLFGAFFGSIAYFLKQQFVLIPFLFLCTIIAISAIASWRQLRQLEATNLTPGFSTSASSVTGVQEKAKQDREGAYQQLRMLPKPRSVRLKPVPRVISIAFPVSWIAVGYFGFKIFRNGPAFSSVLPDLAPLLIIIGIWSALSVVIMRRARKDRRLLEEGDFAIATITHQRLTGDSHPRNRITYEFEDAAALRVQCETTDDSHTLYEEMETAVFYNPANSRENVPLVCASCELKLV